MTHEQRNPKEKKGGHVPSSVHHDRCCTWRKLSSPCRLSILPAMGVPDTIQRCEAFTCWVLMFAVRKGNTNTAHQHHTLNKRTQRTRDDKIPCHGWPPRRRKNPTTYRFFPVKKIYGGGRALDFRFRVPPCSPTVALPRNESSECAVKDQRC